MFKDEAMKFSNFSVWEDEIRKLIVSIASATKIESSRLENWFYLSGALASYKGQSEYYKTQVASSLVKTGKYPNVTEENMAAQHKAGFDQVLAELKKIYPEKIDLIKEIFAPFIAKIASTHNDFRNLQATITTKMHELLNREEIFDFIPWIYGEFNAVQATGELAIDINLHIQHMAKYIEITQMQSTSSSSNYARLFKSTQQQQKIDDVEYTADGP
ncbi:MAG: hypothetical protein Q8M03_15955 [Legionella sp.]|nr:hypothetical protein [Legionella sp.]